MLTQTPRTQPSLTTLTILYPKTDIGTSTILECRFNEIWGGARFARRCFVPGARLRLGANTSFSRFLSSCSFFMVPGKQASNWLPALKIGSRAFYKKKNLKRANKTTHHQSPKVMGGGGGVYSESYTRAIADEAGPTRCRAERIRRRRS
jgi:hypothetical protein